MEFNATTFILEIINFLILLWILHRLLYKPVLAMIAKRKQFIDDSLDESKKLHQEAEDLRAQYESRQQLWQQEKAAAQTKFRQELDEERRVHLEQLRLELEQVREREQAHLSRQQEEFRQQAEKQAMENGARFAGLLLRQTAGPELETRLINLFLDNPEDLLRQNRLLSNNLNHQSPDPIKVTSAYRIADDLKARIEARIGGLISHSGQFQYLEDPALIAGLRIDIGAWVLHLSVEHELKGFAELAYGPVHG